MSIGVFVFWLYPSSLHFETQKMRKNTAIIGLWNDAKWAEMIVSRDHWICKCQDFWFVILFFLLWRIFWLCNVVLKQYWRLQNKQNMVTIDIFENQKTNEKCVLLGILKEKKHNKYDQNWYFWKQKNQWKMCIISYFEGEKIIKILLQYVCLKLKNQKCNLNKKQKQKYKYLLLVIQSKTWDLNIYHEVYKIYPNSIHLVYKCSPKCSYYHKNNQSLKNYLIKLKNHRLFD